MSDALDAATNAGEMAGIIYGKLDVSAQFVVLRKGEKKRHWVEGESDEGKQSEVHIVCNLIDPLVRPGAKGFMERSILANTREWSGIVWASARDLGVQHARELHGKWAKIILAKTGRTYEKNGETFENTTFKFLALYNSEADCMAAFEADGGVTEETTGENAASSANDAEKATAAQFLPALVKAANGNLDVLKNNLASMSPINKYFTVDSPEVQELLKKAA